jgi:membrane protein DedA with SNARE-associated domain
VIFTVHLLSLIPGALWRAMGLLYIEESGVIMPVPGDAFLIYAGHHVGAHWVLLTFAWLVLTLAVVAGATNLYLLSRFAGRRLARGRVGVLLHLSERRLERAEHAFRRFGPVALIFGRHVPGLRIPITVAAGMLGVPYPLFAACVAISTAVWAGFWLVIGVLFGDAIWHLIDRYKVYAWAVVVVVVAAFVSYIVVQLRAASRDRF